MVSRVGLFGIINNFNRGGKSMFIPSWLIILVILLFVPFSEILFWGSVVAIVGVVGVLLVIIYNNIEMLCIFGLVISVVCGLGYLLSIVGSKLSPKQVQVCRIISGVVRGVLSFFYATMLSMPVVFMLSKFVNNIYFLGLVGIVTWCGIMYFFVTNIIKSFRE